MPQLYVRHRLLASPSACSMRACCAGDDSAMEETPPQLWLAKPDAAALLVPDGLNSGDRARWERLRGRAKGVEWAASRALRDHVSRSTDAATSLTHSAGHAALAIGPAGSRVGVDLEAVLPRAVTRLAGFCFAPEEARELEDADGAGALVDFYVRWTLKEAFAKVTGLRAPDLQLLFERR